MLKRKHLHYKANNEYKTRLIFSIKARVITFDKPYDGAIIRRWPWLRDLYEMLHQSVLIPTCFDITKVKQLLYQNISDDVI